MLSTNVTSGLIIYITFLLNVFRMKLLLIVLLAGLAAESLAKTSCDKKTYMEYFELKQVKCGSTKY